jgi:hypothetical protein
MKALMIFLAITFSVNLLAAGYWCREDNRLNNGSLREVILLPGANGFTLQSQYVESIDSPNVEIEKMAQNLDCRIDEKSPIAFCKSNESQEVVSISDVRETRFNSLKEDEKKQSQRFSVISVHDKNGKMKKMHLARLELATSGS